MQCLEIGLVIKEIHLRRAAVHEEVDHPLRLGRELGGREGRVLA
jgi:hypothetical protein